MHDARVEISTVIAAPRIRVFDFLVNPNKIPLVLPGLVENTEIPPLPLKKGSKFRYKYQMYGVMLEGHWTVTDMDAPSRYDAVTDGDIESNWKYRLSEQNGSTKLEMVVTYQTPQTLAGRIKGDVLVRINEQEAEHYFKNLKTVLEMQA
jgi:uncharacterized protein YndB with AHSA1/START domain